VSGKRKQNTIKMTTPSDGQGRSLQRWLGHREDFGEAYPAVGGLVSDRAARR
jgi:hypothetical protein